MDKYNVTDGLCVNWPALATGSRWSLWPVCSQQHLAALRWWCSHLRWPAGRSAFSASATVGSQPRCKRKWKVCKFCGQSMNLPVKLLHTQSWFPKSIRWHRYTHRSQPRWWRESEPGQSQAWTEVQPWQSKATSTSEINIENIKKKMLPTNVNHSVIHNQQCVINLFLMWIIEIYCTAGN